MRARAKNWTLGELGADLLLLQDSQRAHWYYMMIMYTVYYTKVTNINSRIHSYFTSNASSADPRGCAARSNVWPRTLQNVKQKTPKISRRRVVSMLCLWHQNNIAKCKKQNVRNYHVSRSNKHNVIRDQMLWQNVKKYHGRLATIVCITLDETW
jgi:hypothetical protein